MVIVKAQETEKIERKGIGYSEMEKLDITEQELIEFEKSHIKYKEVVKQVLEGWSPSTNNDTFLYFEVLRALGLIEVTSGKDNYIFKIKRENIKYLPCPETIRRSRQSLNSKGLCLPTNPEVLDRRKRREVAVRKYFQENK